MVTRIDEPFSVKRCFCDTKLGYYLYVLLKPLNVRLRHILCQNMNDRNTYHFRTNRTEKWSLENFAGNRKVFFGTYLQNRLDEKVNKFNFSSIKECTDFS